MTQNSRLDGRLDYTQWASRLTHSEHEKAQDEFMWKGRRVETRTASGEVTEPSRKR